MKKNLLLVAAALLTGVLTYALLLRTATQEHHTLLQRSDGEMEWLRKEFKLTEAQFIRIKTLHENYEPICMQLCAKVSQANERLEKNVQDSRAVTPEVADALKTSMVVQEECRKAMLGHIYAVSQEMSPDQGARYLRMMLPHIVQPPIMASQHHH